MLQVINRAGGKDGDYADPGEHEDHYHEYVIWLMSFGPQMEHHLVTQTVQLSFDIQRRFPFQPASRFHSSCQV